MGLIGRAARTLRLSITESNPGAAWTLAVSRRYDKVAASSVNAVYPMRMTSQSRRARIGSMASAIRGSFSSSSSK
jgi:hypothetical protein